ncbi:hypothetical protein HY495_02160 [Candidatus Woesearchaeota archaeon]|nr:hypothetical protein [Candidatus Woesearchaeota archaeon]
MVQFLNDLIKDPLSGEDDEPPPSEMVEENGTVIYGLLEVLYGSVLGYGHMVEANPTALEDTDLGESLYQGEMPDNFISDNVEWQDIDNLKQLLENSTFNFEQAMVDYIFDPPSLENDEMAVDRELLNDQGRALVPYERRLMLSRAAEEDRIVQRALGYQSIRQN